MRVEELIETGVTFDRYEIASNYTGEVLGSFEDKYDAMDAYGEEEVSEWAAHAAYAGFAGDCLSIKLDD